MSDFSVWAFSIAGIVVVGVLADLLLPEGNMHAYLKSIFSIFTVFVIVYPLPKLINSQLDFAQVFSLPQETVSEDIQQGVSQRMQLALEQALQQKLSEKGFWTDVRVEGTFSATETTFEKIRIIIQKSEYDESVENINKQEAVRTIVMDCVPIEKERILVYG